MPQFARALPLDLFTEARVRETPWLHDLFRLWQPAGSKPATHSHSDLHLRLAVRDGYLNYYRDGQSVAKVKRARDGGLSAQVHAKYVERDPKAGQRYCRVDTSGVRTSKGLLAYDSGDGVAAWAAAANGYRGDEKRFVEQIVAANPNVIDLEMGLPASDRSEEEIERAAEAVGPEEEAERVAPRIDIVALEPDDGGWRIALWEAKLVEDGRLRCRGPEMPEVVKQLQKYSTWIAAEARKTEIVRAYRATCEYLVELHAVAKHLGFEIGELGQGIQEVQGGAKLTLDPQVRLLIGASERSTDGPSRRRKKPVDVAASRRSFEKGHLEKLRKVEQLGRLPIQMVTTADEMVLGGAL